MSYWIYDIFSDWKFAANNCFQCAKSESNPFKLFSKFNQEINLNESISNRWLCENNSSSLKKVKIRCIHCATIWTLFIFRPFYGFYFEKKSLKNSNWTIFLQSKNNWTLTSTNTRITETHNLMEINTHIFDWFNPHKSFECFHIFIVEKILFIECFFPFYWAHTNEPTFISFE